MSETARTWIKDALWTIVFAGVVASIFRFASGLGTVTGLNDSAPWGLWIAFKLVFVALAGGGFTLAGMVYVFHLERYRPILRRAILIALLGYGSFIISLIFDLGLPWHIYMPILNWQHHSVMFEIAWCVLLYFSVLVLEFSPAILEHPWLRHPIFKKILSWLHRLTAPLIIAGIVLSTLHQSSLGSLFLIMPHRVHPLWYSPWIPYMFFASAIAAGLMALVLEGFLGERWFHRGLHLDLLTRLGKGAILPLSIYLILRLTDQWMRGVLPGALDGSWQSALYIAEIFLGGLLPILLLSNQKIRQKREGLLTSAILVIAGIASQRMSLSMFTMFRPEGTSYIPSLAEVVIALAIPAAAILIYLFFVENFSIYEQQTMLAESQKPALATSWTRRPLYPQPSVRTVIGHRSSLAILVIALTLAFLVSASQTPASPVSAASGWETLKIDGNNTAFQVDFPHVEHQERLADQNAGEDSCQECHHLDKPGDQATACGQCHTDYHFPRSIFNHEFHQQKLGGNQSCLECHSQEHMSLTAEICQDCHETMQLTLVDRVFNMHAPSFIDAMHGKCLGCHEEEALEQERPELAQCHTCHTDSTDKSNQIIASLPGR